MSPQNVRELRERAWEGASYAAIFEIFRLGLGHPGIVSKRALSMLEKEVNS
jgi:hypothetical protein